jgi:putative acetyltransferase
VRIVRDDLSGPGIVRLLEEHLRDMRATSPPESVHALEPGHGEIKSMRTADSHRGRGIGTAMLRHLLAEARARGLARLSLETGSQPFFAPARALYLRHGFAPCPPFAGYTDDPNSTYLTLGLRPDTAP